MRNLSIQKYLINNNVDSLDEFLAKQARKIDRELQRYFIRSECVEDYLDIFEMQMQNSEWWNFLLKHEIKCSIKYDQKKNQVFISHE